MIAVSSAKRLSYFVIGCLCVAVFGWGVEMSWNATVSTIVKRYGEEWAALSDSSVLWKCFGGVLLVFDVEGCL